MRCVLRHIQALLIAIVSVAAASAQQAPEPADTVAAAEPDTVAVPPPPPACRTLRQSTRHIRPIRRFVSRHDEYSPVYGVWERGDLFWDIR